MKKGSQYYRYSKWLCGSWSKRRDCGGSVWV